MMFPMLKGFFFPPGAEPALAEVGPVDGDELRIGGRRAWPPAYSVPQVAACNAPPGAGGGNCPGHGAPPAAGGMPILAFMPLTSAALVAVGGAPLPPVLSMLCIMPPGGGGACGCGTGYPANPPEFGPGAPGEVLSW